LVKEIQIGESAVKIVYKIDSPPFVQAPEGGVLLHCWRRVEAATRTQTSDAKNTTIVGIKQHRSCDHGSPRSQGGVLPKWHGKCGKMYAVWGAPPPGRICRNWLENKELGCEAAALGRWHGFAPRCISMFPVR
jgi:hypothetical protein